MVKMNDKLYFIGGYEEKIVGNRRIKIQNRDLYIFDFNNH